jgi:hypothetical protein
MKKQLLNEGFWLDLGATYIIAKKIITPFSKWKAFSLGLIDEKGKTLRKPVSGEEKDSFTFLDKFIRNVRVLIGDSLFIKLGISSLLIIDFKSDKFKNEKAEDGLFKYIKENISKNMISIDVMLTAAGENVYFYYNEDLDRVDFNISLQYGGETMSSINGMMLQKESTLLFLDRLNYVFNNLELGGFETIEIFDGAMQHSVSANYGKNEIKISKSTMSDNLEANLFLMLGNDIQREKFVNGWNNFYGKVKTI